MVWVMEHSAAELGPRLVLLVLAEHAHDDGSKAFPSVETMMLRTRLSRRSVQGALRKLESDRHIVQTGKTQSGTNVYRVLGIRGGADSARGGADFAARGAQISTSGGAGSAPDPSLTQEQDPSIRDSVSILSEKWLSLPAVIAHRPSYFATPSVEATVKRVLKVYPVDAIADAIANYAVVLAGADYRWSHRWTFVDFLNRGLDKFVAEAEPLRNYRSGQQTRTEDFDDLPEL